MTIHLPRLMALCSRRLCLQFVATGLITLLAACSSSAAGKDLAGIWYFANGQTGDSTAFVAGTLTLEDSGKYEDSHRIGSILTYSKGTYTVSGDTLKLVPEEGYGSPITYTYYAGEHQDKAGTKFTGLTLKGSSGLTFLLTKEKP